MAGGYLISWIRRWYGITHSHTDTDSQTHRQIHTDRYTNRYTHIQTQGRCILGICDRVNNLLRLRAELAAN